MKSPIGLNVVLVVIGATLFYTYVGQLVPQKELQPPPKVEITAEMTPAQLAKIGDSIAHDKGLCLTCHTVGKTGGLRFPDLAGPRGFVANTCGHTGNFLDRFRQRDYARRSAGADVEHFAACLWRLRCPKNRLNNVPHIREIPGLATTPENN